MRKSKKTELKINQRHIDILEFAKRYMRENNYPPTEREIMAGVGFRSTQSIVKYMREMHQLGLIVMRKSPRAFYIPGVRYVFEDKPVVLDGEEAEKA